MYRFVLALCATLAASGCLTIYSPEVQQGNIVDQEMVDKLKPGMTRAQVRFVLGTPLVVDPFHSDRWDYVYFFKPAYEGAPETRRLTVIFDGDALARMEGDVVPDAPAAAKAQPPAEQAQQAPDESAPGSRAL
ncbi:MAG: outer membrane protein assembly factor BamE [Gammaproteobacteria bacterium]